MDVLPDRVGVNLLADAHFLPFRDKSIGNILCKSVLEHVGSPVKVVLEMRRISVGSIIIFVPNIINLRRIFRTLRNPLYPISPNTRHLQAWESKEIRHLAFLTGLSVKSISWTGHPLFASHMVAVFSEGKIDES